MQGSEGANYSVPEFVHFAGISKVPLENRSLVVLRVPRNRRLAAGHHASKSPAPCGAQESTTELSPLMEGTPVEGRGDRTQ